MRQRRTLGQSVQVGRFNMKHLMCAGQCAPQLVEVALVSCRRCCDCSAAVLSLLFSGWFMVLLFYDCGRLCLLVRDKLLLYSLRCLLPWLFCSCSCFLSPWWLLLPVAFCGILVSGLSARSSTKWRLALATLVLVPSRRVVNAKERQPRRGVSVVDFCEAVPGRPALLGHGNISITKFGGISSPLWPG